MIQRSAKLFGQQLLCVIVSFFMFFSINTIYTFAFGRTVHDVFAVYPATGETTFLYSYGEEDTQRDSFVSPAYEISVQERKEVSPGKQRGANTLTLVLSVVFLAVVLYAGTWKMGNSDQNMVRIGQRRENRLNGLWIGCLSNIPALLLYLVFLAGAYGWMKPMPLTVYRGFNILYYGWIQSVFGSATASAQLSPVQLGELFLPLLVVPAVACFGYWLGYKDIRLFDRLVYKKS